jgi:hypothetical protein
MTSMLPGGPGPDPVGGTGYAPGPPPAADPGASRLDWHHEVRPRAHVDVPPGHLAVQVMNA